VTPKHKKPIRNTVLPHAPYLATKDGEDVLDNSEIISDQIVGGLIAQLLGQKFEATPEDWTDGFFLAFEVILSAGSDEARANSLSRMEKLATGKIVLG